MPRPVVYDLTYIADRLGGRLSGIERIDAAMGRHFVARHEDGPGSPTAAAVHYGLLRPHAFAASTARRLFHDTNRASQADGGLDEDLAFTTVASWLRDPAPPHVPLRVGPRSLGRRLSLERRLARLRWLIKDDRVPIPSNAIYLNVAQYAFEYPHFFRWLERRRDVRSVFFIHDMLALDHPEFFRDGYRFNFERRVDTMARFMDAAIVSNETVADRVVTEMKRRGRPHFPIFSAAVPPPTHAETPDDQTAEQGGLAEAHPYFVVVGTIEPRKNHLLLLHLWRALAARETTVPRLVLVGARGWENEQVLDLLKRCVALAPHVAEVSGLTTRGLRRLIQGARAVLIPSFAEGYGLPLTEALSEGTPAIASDIAVFRTVSQSKALLLDPTDGPGWGDAVMRLMPPGSPFRAELVAQAKAYQAPTWPDYFAKLERFLDAL